MPISVYTKPVENNLQKYIPLPFQEIMQASQMINQRGEQAIAQEAQLQSGLASMEANAPAYAQFRDKFANEYKTNASKLLDKFGGNASNPEFIGEMRKLNLQFASDPRLSTIKQGNEFIKSNEKIRQELDAKGEKYLDPMRGFTGQDANGNLVAPTKGVHAATFDKDIDFLLDPASRAFDYQGYYKTNKKALMGIAREITNNPQYEPIIRQTTQYFQQQGMPLDQAYKSAAQYVASRAQSRITKDFDSGMASYDETRKLRAQQARLATAPQAPNAPFSLLSYDKPIVNIDGKENPRSKIASTVEAVMSNLDGKGNLSTNSRYIEATPENIAANPNAKRVYKSFPGDKGLGDTTPRHLEIKGYNPEEVNLLNTARKVLGVTGGSAKEILGKYSTLIKSFDAASQSIKSTDNKKLNDITADIARRQIASGEVYTAKNGQLVKVADEKDIESISNINGDNVSGISPKSVGQLNGYTQFTDKKGKIYYTPIPKEYQQQFRGSKVVENYIQDFETSNLKQVPASIGGKKANIFINPNDRGTGYVFNGQQGILTPYKAHQDGKLVGGGLFTYMNGNKQETAIIPLSQLEEQEFQSLFIKTSNDNKIQGN